MTANSRPPIIILEDNPLILLDMQTTLEDLGFTNILPASTLEEASQLLDAHPAAAALLDIDIRGDLSFGLALKMLGEKRLFAFLTGYVDPVTMPAELRGIAVLQKPVQSAELDKTVRLLLRR